MAPLILAQDLSFTKDSDFNGEKEKKKRRRNSSGGGKKRRRKD